MENTPTLLQVLLADDDIDDCHIFKDALEELLLPVQLTIVNDGEELMHHLDEVTANLPDALFLDLNMPRKNGFKCLEEIKRDEKFKTVPVIIYSTSYDDEKANLLYNEGANYYICKPADFNELKEVVEHALVLVQQNNLHPSREKFLLSTFKTNL